MVSMCSACIVDEISGMILFASAPDKLEFCWAVTPVAVVAHGRVVTGSREITEDEQL